MLGTGYDKGNQTEVFTIDCYSTICEGRVALQPTIFKKL